MAAYTPREWLPFLLSAAWIPVVLLLGWLILRFCVGVWARLAAWSLVVGSALLVHFLCIDEPAGLRMLLFCGAVLFAMKAVVAVEVKRREGISLGPWRWMQWAGMWPGMIPNLFRPEEREEREGARALFVRGTIWILVGATFLGLARWSWLQTRSLWLCSFFLLPGVSLILHFGLFNWLSGVWRWRGVDVDRLFPAPLLSTSLTEFWGRRWNLPFTEMIQRSVYWPLSPYLGRNGAAMTGFLFSGLLHEMAISVPVQQGYGLPLLYFLVHGGLIVLERTVLLPRGWLTETPWVGRTWTLLWLALPMPILFHPAFLRGVLWPLIGAG